MNNNHEKTRHMDAGQLFDEYYDEKNPNLKETTYNIFMSGSMDTEKAFFLVLKKHVELAKSDKNIEESLKVFCNSFNEILTKYLDIQDGKQERIFFAHAVGYILFGESYLIDESISDMHIEELYYFIEHGQIRDRIATYAIHSKYKIAEILMKKF